MILLLCNYSTDTMACKTWLHHDARGAHVIATGIWLWLPVSTAQLTGWSL